MKKYLINIFALAVILPFGACNKFLDVKPRDKFLKSQVFRTENGINSALNNLYLGMAKNSLYGGNLTMSAVEVLAQRYNEPSTTDNWHEYATYSYKDAGVQATFDDVWSDAYSLILDINSFIGGLNMNPGVITADKAAILKGEAYGLRAMLHFDLLRLFGPVYSRDPAAPSIPYYRQATARPHDILPADMVLKDVLADLDSAAILLKNDPIIKSGVQHTLENDGNDFYRYRNYRMNYYAVIALQARVNLYAGDTEAALAAAKTVIDSARQWFPWTDPSDIISENQNPDRTFSPEVIFGIQNMDLYEQQDALFSGNLSSTSILAPLPDRLTAVFEGNENDYRYNPCWKVPSTGSVTYRTFFKYADVVEPEMDFRFLQPLIRLSEMYYIAAETDPDPAEALEYLNTVRFHRGLIDLEPGADLQAEIGKEYAREFYGEGQLFFYYKRRAVSAIPNGSSSSGNIDMTDAQYVVPLPLSETEYRN